MTRWIISSNRTLSQTDGNGGDLGGDVKEGVLVAEPKTKLKRPPFYKVMLLNDDYTPMDFVVFVLKDVFHKDHEDAIRTMLEVHHQGAGVCGTFTRDVAETKVDQVVRLARQNEHPLQCVMQQD
jgi:ATP-dependent Clp protease adaptor protein ClpS